MSKEPTTVEEENLRRYNLRKIILTIGTPFIVVVLVAAVFVVNSILTTLSAQKMYSFDAPVEVQQKATELVNRSAYTSAFLEGYKAKYNYATSIAEQNPLTTIAIYTTDVIPYSPPTFGCYPALNGLYYSEKLGDEHRLRNELPIAELYYNYAQYFLEAAQSFGCSSSSSSSSNDNQQSGGGGSIGNQQDQEPQSGDKSDENKKDIQDKKDELDEKREDVREKQGKENNKRQNNGDKPSEDQKKQNQDSTEDSEKRQNDTKNIRDADKNREPLSGSPTPW